MRTTDSCDRLAAKSAAITDTSEQVFDGATPKAAEAAPKPRILPAANGGAENRASLCFGDGFIKVCGSRIFDFVA